VNEKEDSETERIEKYLKPFDIDKADYSGDGLFYTIMRKTNPEKDDIGGIRIG
jgi:hypothetical protein